MRRSPLAGLGAVGCVVGLVCLPWGTPAALSESAGPAAGASVNVFPAPGSNYVSLNPQVVFRGISPGLIGTVSITGSISGTHTWTRYADTDGNGASIIPTRPLAPGETVTVKTSLNIVGGTQGVFKFHVMTPTGGHLPDLPFPPTSRVAGDVLHFVSRPDLQPAAIRVRKSSPRTARGDIFLAPEVGPLADGPTILDRAGGLVWFQPLPHGDFATDVKVQRYQGHPVVTWWQGQVGAGVGEGEDVIEDTSYRQLAVVHAGNGLRSDMHEFKLTPDGNALITAYKPVIADASGEHGSKQQIVYDAVAQEIDIHSCQVYPTCLVLLEWDALDNVPMSDTHALQRGGARAPFDPYHVNSIDPETDGNFLISVRNTWSAYKVDHRSGATIWVLGGKHSSFKMGRGAQFAFQHDVRAHGDNDQEITVYDDGAGYFKAHSQSRGLTLQLDFGHKRATRVGEQFHSPPILSARQGSDQQLSTGGHLIGWGGPYFTEFDPRGQMIFDARFVDRNSTYRVFRAPWSGTPGTPPALVGRTAGRSTTVWASWNGATNVVFWRVLAGPAPNSLHSTKTAHRTGFETTIAYAAQTYAKVQALDGAQRVLGQSATIRVKR